MLIQCFYSLPFMLAVIISSGFAGFVISASGNYWYILVFRPWFISVGAGLLYTLRETTSDSKYIGYQVKSSFKVILIRFKLKWNKDNTWCGRWYCHAGNWHSITACSYVFTNCLSQNSLVAVQANVKPEDLAQTSALVTFAQLLGGVLGIGICGAVFANELASNLVKYAPDAPFALVRDSVSAIYTLPVQQEAGVIHAYVLVNLVLWAYDSDSLLTSFWHKAVDKVFLVAVACGALGSLSAPLICIINIKGRAMGGMAAWRYNFGRTCVCMMSGDCLALDFMPDYVNHPPISYVFV